MQASVSFVLRSVIDCTATGWPAPMATLPIFTSRLRRLFPAVASAQARLSLSFFPSSIFLDSIGACGPHLQK